MAAMHRVGFAWLAFLAPATGFVKVRPFEVKVAESHILRNIFPQFPREVLPLNITILCPSKDYTSDWLRTDNVTLTWNIGGGEPSSAFTTVGKLGPTEISRTSTRFNQVTMKEVPKGSYTLYVELYDMAGNLLQERKANFVVCNPYAQIVNPPNGSSWPIDQPPRAQFYVYPLGLVDIGAAVIINQNIEGVYKNPHWMGQKAFDSAHLKLGWNTFHVVLVGDDMQQFGKEWQHTTVSFELLPPANIDESMTMAMAEELKRDVHAVQHPADCTKAKLLVLEYHHSGLGSFLHWQAYGLTAALHTGRTVVTHFGDDWLYAPGKCKEDEDCYLKPLTNCYRRHILESEKHTQGSGAPGHKGRVGFGPKSEAAGDRVVWLSLNEWWEYSRGDAETVVSRNFVPHKYRALGMLWFRSVLMDIVVRPDDDLAATLASTQKELNFRVPCTAMSIRRGTKWKEAALQPMEGYVQAAVEMQNLNLHLMYDEPVTLQEFEEFAKGKNFHLSYTRYERPVTGTKTLEPFMDVNWMSAVNAKGEANAVGMTTDMLINALLARQCVALVGTMSSNVSRLIYELIIGLLGRVDTVKLQSLDSEWYIEV